MPADGDALRGERWVDGVLGCRGCHDGARPLALEAGQVLAVLEAGRRVDGRALVGMPSERWRGLSLADQADVVAALAERPLGAPDRAGPWAHALADLTAPRALDAPVPAPEPGPDAAYGAYLGRVAGCVDCHAADGRLGREHLAGWTGADFSRALRRGIGREGQPLRKDWSGSAALDDVEIEALWAWLRPSGP